MTSPFPTPAAGRTALRIRTATPADAAFVAALVREAYAPYVARIGREPAPMQDDYGRLIREGVVRVAECEAHLLGVLVLVPQDDALLLDNIAVSPSAQKRGVGRALLAHAEREALCGGYARIRLYTNEAMSENLSLYLRIGYIETGRGEQSGFRRVFMEKALSGEAARPASA